MDGNYFVYPLFTIGPISHKEKIQTINYLKFENEILIYHRPSWDNFPKMLIIVKKKGRVVGFYGPNGLLHKTACRVYDGEFQFLRMCKHRRQTDTERWACSGEIAGQEKRNRESGEWTIWRWNNLMGLRTKGSPAENTLASSAPTLPSSIPLSCSPYVSLGSFASFFFFFFF